MTASGTTLARPPVWRSRRHGSRHTASNVRGIHVITVHHLNNSRSQRVLWMLEELDVPYEVKRYERDPATMRAPASLRTVHPLGKSPVITDEGRVIAESGAIIDYLA